MTGTYTLNDMVYTAEQAWVLLIPFTILFMWWLIDKRKEIKQ